MVEKSISCRLYRCFKNIYINSRVVNGFSAFLSGLLNAVIHSRTFLSLSNPKGIETFQNSIAWKSMEKLFCLGTKLFHFNGIKIAVENSFFIKFIENILEKRKKEVINQLYLLLILTLVTNMTIKVLTGSFSIIGNKTLIGLLLGLILLYLLQLDYPVIFSNSKVLSTLHEVFYDEKINQDT